jgi:outer membrane immunogenic protein
MNKKGEYMTLFRLGAFTALALVMSQQANAQGFRGVRADVQAGLDKFNSEGNSDSGLAVGASAGVDFDLGGFVVGPEVSFMWSPRENETRDGPGVAYRKSFEEWGLGLRAGSLISPSTLLYGKAMFVVNEQRKYFNRDAIVTPGFPAGNPTFGDYYNHYRTRGWQVGAGVEQMLSDSFYVKAEGRYSNYRTNSSRLTGMLGLGVLFGPGAPEPVVVAPPPAPVAPPPPATQTCPDGSVILATDACPVPPPPPPPPAPAPERG